MKELNEILKDVLPKDEQFEIYHLQSPSREIHGFKKRNIDRNECIVKCSHFLSLAYKGKIFFAIDINIYFEISESKVTRTLFISKADTNGFLDNGNVKIGLIVETFISYLLMLSPKIYLNKIIPLTRNYKNIHDKPFINKKTSTAKGYKILSKRYIDKGTKEFKKLNTHEKNLFKTIDLEKYKEIVTKISLFTRPEPHYLFTNSGENPKKHLLSGEALLRWWLKIVNKISNDKMIFKQDESLCATLELPGEEHGFIERRYLKELSCFWKTGTIYGNYSDSLFGIPIFHDDPKTRFLKDLMVENKYNILTLKEFWRDLEMRQEFRLGVVVGVIGVAGKTLLNSLQEQISNNDSLLASSKQKYKQIKSYIVGEEYDNEEGAIDARNNFNAIWLVHNKMNFKITGRAIFQEKNVQKPQQEVNIITFRRKKK